MKAMNKKIRTILIISVIFFGASFLFVSSARAGTAQFGVKQIFVDFDGLPFNLNNFVPGTSSLPKTIIITNNESFNINLYFRAEKTSGDDVLADALTIVIGSQSNHLSYLFNNNITLGTINSGSSQSYDITIIFDAGAGNKYQDKSIDFNFILTAEEEHQQVGPILPVIIPGGGGGGGGGTAAYCGDGSVDEFRYEECDDGNNIDGDGCSSACVIEGEVKGVETEQSVTTPEGEEGVGGPSFAKASEGEGEVAGEVVGEGETPEGEEGEEEGEIILPEGVAGVFKESINCAKWWIFLILLVINALIWLIFTKKERRKIFFILGLALLIILFILWLILPCLSLWLIIVLEAIYLVLAILFGRLRSRKE